MKKTFRRATPYLGGDDPSQWIHSNRTHRTASEAFKDAEYATAFYRPKSEWQDCMEFCGGLVVMSPAIGFALYAFYLVTKGV